MGFPFAKTRGNINHYKIILIVQGLFFCSYEHNYRKKWKFFLATTLFMDIKIWIEKKKINELQWITKNKKNDTKSFPTFESLFEIRGLTEYPLSLLKFDMKWRAYRIGLAFPDNYILPSDWFFNSLLNAEVRCFLSSELNKFWQTNN